MTKQASDVGHWLLVTANSHYVLQWDGRFFICQAVFKGPRRVQHHADGMMLSGYVKDEIREEKRTANMTTFTVELKLGEGFCPLLRHVISREECLGSQVICFYELLPSVAQAYLAEPIAPT